MGNMPHARMFFDFVDSVVSSGKREFSLYQWSKHCESSDFDARKQLRPYENAGVIRYTELLHWELLHEG